MLAVLCASVVVTKALEFGADVIHTILSNMFEEGQELDQGPVIFIASELWEDDDVVWMELDTLRVLFDDDNVLQISVEVAQILDKLPISDSDRLTAKASTEDAVARVQPLCDLVR
jgi:hypothetical protein